MNRNPAHSRRPALCITICIYELRYEWDETKNLRNQRKHGGISFELAALVFDDERCLVHAERIDERTAEQRWHAIGAARIDPAAEAVLLVVHVYREDYRGEEIIRIISARAAENHEIRRYWEPAMD
ncbi:MAG: BrnT family toxin [Bryobacteraceae bacterium]